MNFHILEHKVKWYWFTWRLLLLIILASGFIVGLIKTPEKYQLLVIIPSSILVFIVTIYTFIFPTLQYKAYKYYLDDEKIVIEKGVLFKHYTIVPLVQVQDIGSYQGPIQILFKIRNVIITTAGSVESIVCLNEKLANQIVDDIQRKIHNRFNKENSDEALS